MQFLSINRRLRWIEVIFLNKTGGADLLWAKWYRKRDPIFSACSGRVLVPQTYYPDVDVIALFHSGNANIITSPDLIKSIQRFLPLGSFFCSVPCFSSFRLTIYIRFCPRSVQRVFRTCDSGAKLHRRTLSRASLRRLFISFRSVLLGFSIAERGPRFFTFSVGRTRLSRASLARPPGRRQKQSGFPVVIKRLRRKTYHCRNFLLVCVRLISLRGVFVPPRDASLSFLSLSSDVLLLCFRPLFLTVLASKSYQPRGNDRARNDELEHSK